MHKISCLCWRSHVSDTVLHEIQLNVTQHSKQQCFWCPLLPFLNLSFLYLGRRILACYSAVYRQSLHMIYSSLSCEVSSKIHLFTILCNSLMFLQPFLNGSRQNVKKLNHNKIVRDSLLQVIWGREAIHLLNEWYLQSGERLKHLCSSKYGRKLPAFDEITCLLKCLINFKCQVSFLHVGLALVLR